MRYRALRAITKNLKCLHNIINSIIRDLKIFLYSRFANDIEYMTGKRPYLFWMICWKYISPLAIFIIFMANVVKKSSGVAQYSAYVGCKEQYVS